MRPSFAELKDSCTAEANWAINEAENLAVEHEGLVLVGIFLTGGNRDGMADTVLRLQSSWVGGRVSYLLTSAAPFLGEARQLFTDRVRKPKRKGKGEGQRSALLTPWLRALRFSSSQCIGFFIGRFTTMPRLCSGTLFVVLALALGCGGPSPSLLRSASCNRLFIGSFFILLIVLWCFSCYDHSLVQGYSDPMVF